MATIHHGDALDFARSLADNSVDLIATDPPYFRVKDLPWDRQWDNPAAFLAWLDLHLVEWARVLKPNGSLYVFASPEMAARVEVLVAARFRVLNAIQWLKPMGWHQKAEKEAQRSYSSPREVCIFAEHFGADSHAKGEAGYAAKCDEARGFVFEPLRAYLDGERRRAGVDFDQVRAAVGCAAGSGLPSHWFTRSQWMLPTPANYDKLRALFNGGPLPEVGGYLCREYDDLRSEYEALRRPFSVTAEVSYTDVWDFPTVKPYKGKHPCEKPAAMMEHIITASSRPGAVVADFFCGSGATLRAAVKLGRQAIGCDLDAHWCDVARRGCESVEVPVVHPSSAPHSSPPPAAGRKPAGRQLTLFGAA